MLNKSLLFLLLLSVAPSYLSQLTLSHRLSPCTHSRTLAYLHEHLHMSFPRASRLHRPKPPCGSWPQVSHTPLPSPVLALNLLCTLPTTPTFIPAHKQAPTCLPLHSSSSTHRHIYVSHFLGFKHTCIPMHAQSLAHTFTDMCFANQLVLGSQSLHAYTQTTPVHASVPQLVHPLPVRSAHHTVPPTLAAIGRHLPGSYTPLTLIGFPPWLLPLLQSQLPSPSQFSE